MKKILGICLLLQILLIPSVYADELPTISVGSFDAYIGERIIVPITIKNNPGCSYLGIKIYYDTNSLEYIDSKLRGLNNADMKDIVHSEDMITLYAMEFEEDKNIGDNGVIAEITFDVKENAMTSILRLKVTDFGGEDLIDYEFKQHEGVIQIVDKTSLNSTEDLTQFVSPTIEGEIIWKSNDENIATVDEYGNVTFSNEGNTTVAGMDKDGNVVLEKNYKVVAEEDLKETKRESKQKKENILIYILITLGFLLITSCIIVFIKWFHKKK